MFMQRLAISTIMILVVAAANGQDPRPRPWQFYWENDIGVFTKGSDEYYTNGLRLSVGAKRTPDWATRFRFAYCDLGLSPCRRMGGTQTEAVSYAFTHQFWTPQNKAIARPQPRDRPWAGYMYGSVNLQIFDDLGKHQQDVFELQIGILGQGAGAKFVQTEWHKLIDVAEPQGWGNQLRNEPVINLLYVQNRRYPFSKESDHADLIVTSGGILGTLMTYPGVGATLRLGRNITGFPIVPLAPAAATISERPRSELYVHAGFEARWILHNATLDGGLFRDGPSVDRHHGVYDLRGGFSGRCGNWRVTYTLTRRSEEFTPPPGRSNGAHNYNSLTVSYEPQR